MPPFDPTPPPDAMVPGKSEDQEDLMPTERKSTWRTAEERRLSDLTRVLEWLERRQGKKQALQKHAKVVEPPKAQEKEKEDRKPKLTKKQAREGGRVSFSEKNPEPSPRKDKDAVTYRRLYGVEAKGRRLSMVPGNYSKDGPGKLVAEMETKDSAAPESTQRSLPFTRQSLVETMLQDTVYTGRKSILLRDLIGKIPESSYERRLKSLIDRGAEPKAETVKILKPEEVLSCRYLRLSKNNIRTLLKLCKDAGLVVDIHPHMVEAEIDTKKVFATNPMVAL
ncbi:uncharacterized protein C16orf78 homolog [Pteronotus mesoamericanus]|uniref:uncharacterized protein C16orf78 homolog n=1 Tax=Pteronotus mesoamericanus TaxID=1884717 RepID=UPI0023EB0B2C|nr:uncharacterized protein C16orf78 homolog [Pteronotus parnellii mesoamericanus]